MRRELPAVAADGRGARGAPALGRRAGHSGAHPDPDQGADAHQVVDPHREGEHPVDMPEAAMPQLADATPAFPLTAP